MEEFNTKKSLIRVHDEDVKVIRRPGDIFGDSYLLNEDKFDRSFIYAKTKVICF